MKTLYAPLVSVITFFCLLSLTTYGQTQHQHSHNPSAVPPYTGQQTFDPDSLLGYNEAAARQHAAIGSVLGLDLDNYLNYTKRRFIDKKYNLHRPAGSSARGGTDPVPQAPCTNVDFETGNTSGWTVSGDVITTNGAAVDPYGNFPVVCPGGNFSMKLGNATNPTSSIAKQTFAVTPANSYYLLKMAMVILNFPHSAADAAKVYIRFRDQSNNIIACPYFECYYANVGGGASFGLTGFQNGSNGVNIGNQSYPTTYIPWTNVGFDLTPYIGQNVTIEIQNDWCVYDYDWAYTYIDGQCSQLTTSVVGGCAGSIGKLTAPSGMTSYTWTGPPTSTVSAAHTQTVASTVSGTYTVHCTPYSSCGSATYTYTMNLVSSNNPLANFNFTATPCQTTFQVPYTDNTNLNGGAPITNYYWDFDNNGVVDSQTANPVYTFSVPGTYTTKLKVSNGACLDSITKTVSVVPKPVAGFSLTNVCLNATSTFTSGSTFSAALVSQVWNWGDGTGAGMGANPTHAYTTSGTYNVKLIITDANLCKDSTSKPITIYPNPIISFTASPVCIGNSTSFSNTSSIAAPDNISAYAWDFDNNGTTDNTTITPVYNYTAAGTYVTELKATSNNGCKDSSTIVIRVNTLPTATFTPVNACMNSNILLNNTSGIAAPDNIVLYNWNFGPNSTPGGSSIQNPPLLSYSTPGVKTITLDIKTNTTCTASITRTVTVYPQPVAGFSTTSVCQATATAFTDQSTTTVGAITGWEWDFTNDNSIDNTTQSPTFVYPASGTFTASLIATTSNGCKDTVSAAVDVWGHSIPNFSPNYVCYGAATTFTNLTNTTTNANIGGALVYNWAFADGSPNSSIASPVHTYTIGTNANAAYSVTLTATTTNGCVDNIVKQVNVYSVPTASFTSNVVCQGTMTQHTDASNGNGNTINGYLWDFLSNGTVDATGLASANFTYPNYGVNLVSYTVSTTPAPGLTCSNAITTLTVFVSPSPVPDFTFVNACINAQPNSFDASTSTVPVGTITNYAWAFADAGTGSGVTINHTYSTPAVYNVSLTVTSSLNCSTTLVKAVEVYKKPIMSILNTAACDGKAMNLVATPLANSGTVTNWFWDYNNSIGTIEASGQANVNYVFPAAGSQTVALVTVSNPGQCRDTTRLVVYVDYNPKTLFSVDKQNGCPVHCVTFSNTTLPITAPGQNVSWRWDFGDGTSENATSPASQPHCYNNSTSNQLKTFDIKLVVTTDKGCSDSLTKSSFITVYPTPIARYSVSPNPGNIVTPLIYFTNESIDYTRWFWTFGDGGYKTDSVNVNPAHTYFSSTAQTYQTNLIVLNQYGCSDTAYVAVEIGPEFAFYIPNAFTPANGDGINDVFTGAGIGIDKYDMWIYDRWGEMIYYSDDIAKGWNGKKTGKSEEVQQDVYIWKVKIKDVLGKNHEYIGHVTLVR